MVDNMISWGFFDPNGTWGSGHYAWKVGSIVPIAGVIFFVVCFASLLIFRPVFKALGKHPSVTTTIGGIYIGMYVLYYILHITYFFLVLPKVSNHFGGAYNPFTFNIHNLVPKAPHLGNFGSCPVAPPPNILPLHLSSAGELCAASLLITRNKKLFNWTMPIFGILPIAAILSPSKQFYGPENYFYYDYYLNHTLMLMTYWWFYLYGIRQYNFHYLRFAYVSAIAVTLFTFGYDALFHTNLLFVGQSGFNITETVNVNSLFIHPPGAWQSLICIILFGSVFIFITFSLLIAVKPFYSFDDTTKIYDKNIYHSRKEAVIALKQLFIWNKKTMSKL